MPDQTEDLPEAAVDPTTRDILQLITKILWWILYPIGLVIYYILYYLAFAVVFVLRLLYQPLAFVVAPIVHLLQFVWTCLLAPFRFVAKFETIYIYLGTAALIGISGGLIISVIYGALEGPLRLNPEDMKSEASARTAKQYREEKRKKRVKAETPLISSSSGYVSPTYVSLSDGIRKGKLGKGLNELTILEEMDSDY